MQENLHSPHRQLIELRMEHADLDNLIDRAAEQSPVDELTLRRHDCQAGVDARSQRTGLTGSQ